MVEEAWPLDQDLWSWGQNSHVIPVAFPGEQVAMLSGHRAHALLVTMEPGVAARAHSVAWASLLPLCRPYRSPVKGSTTARRTNPGLPVRLHNRYKPVRCGGPGHGLLCVGDHAAFRVASNNKG